jgi:flagellar hook-associated protein 1 FlgK
MDENLLGGGEIPGLLRFQNNDLARGTQPAGSLCHGHHHQHERPASSSGWTWTAMSGGNLLHRPVAFSAATVLKPSTQVASATLTLGISDTSKLVASDYQISFTSATTGSITRRSDGQVSAFAAVPISDRRSEHRTHRRTRMWGTSF